MDIYINNDTKVNITVVGCGGTGSQLLSPLMQLCSNVSSKINKITLVDGDVFEAKNVQNQRCLLDEVGENKAEALAERYTYIYDNLKINYYSDYARNLKDLQNIVYPSKFVGYNRNISILISCVDRNSSRKLFHEYFELAKNEGHNLVYIDAGNGDTNRVGQVITGYTCDKKVYSRPVADYFPDILKDEEDLSTLTNENCTQSVSENPQNIATNVLSATIIFSLVTNIISFAKIEKGVIYFDADKHTVISR